MTSATNAPLLSDGVPILTAPTAAGKTALALALGEAFALEVVSADAFLVYRGLDVGTAKPTPGERARVPHHLVDVADPDEEYDVARFAREAEAAIADVLARGKVPLVTGGTGFYLSALVKGLPTTPRADPVVQRAVEADLAERGLDALLAEIAAADPAEVERLQRNPRRVVRAVEVLRRTGRVPSAFPLSAPRFAYRVVAFSRPPAELDARIAARVDAMLAGGLLDEARSLRPLLGRERRPTALQAIGYREALAFLDGAAGLDETRAAIVAATRAYAKRQLTWIRTQLRANLLSPEEAEDELRASLQNKNFTPPDLS